MTPKREEIIEAMVGAGSAIAEIGSGGRFADDYVVNWPAIMQAAFAAAEKLGVRLPSDKDSD